MCSLRSLRSLALNKGWFTICRIATSRVTCRKSRINFYSSDGVQTSRDSWARYIVNPPFDLLHGSACNMMRYFRTCDSIVTSRRRVEIQSTSEMSPYFTMTKCNKLSITYLTRSTEGLPSLPSSISTISTISMTVVTTTLFKKR